MSAPLSEVINSIAVRAVQLGHLVAQAIELPPGTEDEIRKIEDDLDTLTTSVEEYEDE